jgi:hypothetical protein
LACLHSSHTRPRNGCFRALLACFSRKTGGELPWRCLLRGVAKATSKASAPLGRRQLALASRQRALHPGRQAFSPCNRAAPARHCAPVRRALASLVDPGQGAGAVLKRARSRPLHPSSRGSVWSGRGRVFRRPRFRCSPGAVASIGCDNIRYRKRFLGLVGCPSRTGRIACMGRRNR